MTSYGVTLNNENVASKPLFEGGVHSAKDLARFLLSLKARHMKIGDGILGNIVGIMATFLPRGNIFEKDLPNRPSLYFLLKTLDNLASYKSQLRTLKINCCVRKCMGYYNDNVLDNFCMVCHSCRWKNCIRDCYGERGEKLCEHLQTPFNNLYYNVVQDRLVKLLKSDLRNLFQYQEYRAGECIELS